MTSSVNEYAVSSSDTVSQGRKADVLQPLAIFAAGLAVAGAIYLKPTPVNTAEKFAVVRLEDGQFVIFDDGVARVCIITTNQENAKPAGKGIQYAFIPRCGDAYATE
jgi:hypothetical protein